jgi:hypothetical protein
LESERDPLWLDVDDPRFGKMAEVGRIVKVGFVSDIPGLYFHKCSREVDTHSTKLFTERQPRLTRSSPITWILVSSNKCAALVKLITFSTYFTTTRERSAIWETVL